MKNIANLLSLRPHEVMSIIGCGGKTTLLWGLARHYSAQAVLVSTTTKIGWPAPGICSSMTDAKQIGALIPPAMPSPGIHLAGTLYDDKAHIKSLPVSDLEAILPGFDKAFIEADGSRNLPLKGWAAHEPVVPDFCTVTVGITTISAEGDIVNEKNVHRPNIFCRLSGAQMNGPVTLEHMAAAVAHPEGLMARAAGRKVLLVNQLDSPADFAKAEEFVSLLPSGFIERLEMIIGASLENDSGKILRPAAG